MLFWFNIKPFQTSLWRQSSTTTMICSVCLCRLWQLHPRLIVNALCMRAPVNHQMGPVTRQKKPMQSGKNHWLVLRGSRHSDLQSSKNDEYWQANGEGRRSMYGKCQAWPRWHPCLCYMARDVLHTAIKHCTHLCSIMTHLPSPRSAPTFPPHRK